MASEVDDNEIVRNCKHSAVEADAAMKAVFVCHGPKSSPARCYGQASESLGCFCTPELAATCKERTPR